MIQQQGTRKNECGFVLFPSTTPKHLEVHSSNRKSIITHNNFRHCRVSFSPFVRQPFSKQLYSYFNKGCRIRVLRPRHTMRQITATEFVAAMCRTNSNWFEFVRHIAATKQGQATCRSNSADEATFAATCRCDLSHRVSRPLSLKRRPKRNMGSS